VVQFIKNTVGRIDVQGIRQRVVEPSFLEEFPEAFIIGKLIALSVLPVLIILSLAITYFYHVLIGGILVAIGPDTLMEFVATFSTLALYCMFTYLWFQWVRTGGFGLCGMGLD